LLDLILFEELWVKNDLHVPSIFVRGSFRSYLHCGVGEGKISCLKELPWGTGAPCGQQSPNLIELPYFLPGEMALVNLIN